MKAFSNTLLFLLAGLCLLLPHSTWAQVSALTVHGRVFEKGSRKPLQGAVLVVKEIATLSTVSDEKGSFSLTLPGPGSYTLLASALGADETVSLPVQLDKDIASPALTFYLLPATVLAEVVVSAERNPNQVSKTVIKGEELRQIAGSSGDPLKGLQSLPGVAMSNSGGSAPAVRGSGPGDNFYYADAIPVGKVFHFGGLSVLMAT